MAMNTDERTVFEDPWIADPAMPLADRRALITSALTVGDLVQFETGTAELVDGEIVTKLHAPKVPS